MANFRDNPEYINRKGRPKKGQTLTDLLMTYLKGKDPGDAITRKERFIEECYAAAMKGDATMKKYIWDRIDGSPVQKTENLNLNLPQVVEVDLGEDTPDNGNAAVVAGENTV
jgi:hypothetical protein